MGKKKADAHQSEAEAAPEAVSAIDRSQIPAPETDAPGAAAAGEPADGQHSGEQAEQGDGAPAGENGNDVLVADAVLRGDVDDQQAGQHAVPADGTEVPAQPVVSAEKQPDAVSGDPGEPAADGAGDDPAQDPAPAVEEPAVDLGTAPAEAEGDALSGATLAAFAANVALTVHIWTRDEPVMFSEREAQAMVDFVRENPDAPLLAMYKHLEISERLPPIEPTAGDMLALSLFHAAVTCGLAYERAHAAEAGNLGAFMDTFPRWPGDRAFQVQDQAFSPTGFSPR